MTRSTLPCYYPKSLAWTRWPVADPLVDPLLPRNWQSAPTYGSSVDGDDAQISFAFCHRRRNLAAPALQEHIDTGPVETQATQMQACEKRRQYRLIEPHCLSGVVEDNTKARSHQREDARTRPRLRRTGHRVQGGRGAATSKAAEKLGKPARLPIFRRLAQPGDEAQDF